MRRPLGALVAAISATAASFARLPAVVSIGIVLDVPPQPIKRELAAAVKNAGTGGRDGKIVHITM